MIIKKKKNIHEKSLKNLKSFKPGQSGNPKGRTKGEKTYKKLIRDILDSLLIDREYSPRLKTAIQNLEEQQKVKLSRRHLIIFSQVLKAMAGNTEAFKALADREEGRPLQKTENTDTSKTYLEFLSDLNDSEKNE